MHFTYKVQDKPRGLADVFILGKEFMGTGSVCLVLGDNIFYGYGFTVILENAHRTPNGATIFDYHLYNPKGFGAVEFDDKWNVISITEKPEQPNSNKQFPVYISVTTKSYRSLRT